MRTWSGPRAAASSRNRTSSSEVVEARLDDDHGPATAGVMRAPRSREEPGGGVSDATITYPPPHPENIAPGWSAA